MNHEDDKDRWPDPSSTWPAPAPDWSAMPPPPAEGSPGYGMAPRSASPTPAMSYPPASPYGAVAPGRADWGYQQPTPRSTVRKRITSGLAALAAFFAKFGVVLYKLKYASVLISMLVSIAAYALLWGWTFAAGFVLLLFCHEMGHVIELRRQGVPATAPMFVPFIGAFVNLRKSPANAYREAQVALAGPALGTATSIVVAVWAAHTGSQFLQALAYIGFFLNLFNLLPVVPLDGGRAAGALHPAIWFAGLAGLLLVEVYRPSPVIPLILILGGVELWRRWRSRNSPAARVYFDLSAGQRLQVAAMYLTLVAVTIYGAHATYMVRHIN